ncbi:hypothetical protein BP5796_10899 [Coleophoma crateriformis]|uniref:Kinetochore protein mis13 n=1 Tax=Coleophoma crateriformis TaxID=565419 RepID=A0A3D8QLG6_9HELO|nr:hypothetical protein BP5796_10899 [Coleophoma crateriformis]
MTTIVRARNPLETLSMSQQPQARRRSKRLAAYDDSDGDFVFARVSKKSKTAPAESQPSPGPAPASVARKSKQSNGQSKHEAPTEKKPARRTMNFSTPKSDKEEAKGAKRGARKSTRLSGGAKVENNVNSTRVEADHDSNDMVRLPASDKTNEPTIDTGSTQSTLISLPCSDTPVINRNKELRKKGGGQRRSSLGMRGRRASSLIDNGHSALPHREVEMREFYKHIESDGLSEPRRMKMLLMWTGERVLPEKPSHGDPDAQAKHSACIIADQLLKEFSTKSEFSDWFAREESATLPTKVIKLPNPRNTQYAEKITEMEANIKKLQEERKQWKALAKPPPSLPPLFQSTNETLTASDIDSSILDPEQAAILSSLEASSTNLRKQAIERLSRIQASLEFKVDQFADGVHKLERYQDTASRAADQILALSALRLDDRDRKEKEEIGTKDVPMQEVLRSLSRILPNSSNGR